MQAADCRETTPRLHRAPSWAWANPSRKDKPVQDISLKNVWQSQPICGVNAELVRPNERMVTRNVSRDERRVIVGWGTTRGERSCKVVLTGGNESGTRAEHSGRSGRVVEGSGFENRRSESYQGFESLLLR